MKPGSRERLLAAAQVTHITLSWQYRKCGYTSCSTCRDGQGHGPYWYAYYRERNKLRSCYVGKEYPDWLFQGNQEYYLEKSK